MPCLVNATIQSCQYMLMPPLQEVLFDKDTGQALAYGIVTFYRDEDHLTKKAVYTISGPPDEPVFIELPNPLILSAIGSFIDPNNGQDIVPYLFPYDEDGNIDLYYITVYSADEQGDPAVLQFTRDHFPSIPCQPDANNTILVENFIPNGQFLLHKDVPNSGLVDGDTPFYNIAYGGWSVNIDSGTSTLSTNFLTFERFDSPINDPVADPRYACRFRCTVFDAADPAKKVYLHCTDVNFLQGQEVTFGITAYSNDGIDHELRINIHQSFGAGGSTVVNTVVETFTITPAIQSFVFNFTVPTTIGKTLGSGDDDYMEFDIYYPTDSVFDISIVDVIGVPGTFDVLTYPPQSPEQIKEFALPAAFDTPNYDGSDIGNFVYLTDEGGAFAHKKLSFSYIDLEPRLAQTGMHYAYVGTTAPNGYLLEDGASYAVQAGGDLTPYVNLFNVILPGSDSGTYEYGTGINGFTYALDWPVYGPVEDDEVYVVWNRFDIAQPAPDPGNSGFSFTLTQALDPNIGRQIYLATILPASGISPGDYFRLPVNTTGPQYIQMFWFTIDGVGTQPAPAFNSVVKIDLLSTDTAEQVRDKVMRFANGLFQVPDLPGRFIRYWNNGSYHDPVQAAARQHSQDNTASVLDPQFISYITGNAGDTIGSFQMSKVLPDPAPDQLNFQNLFFNAIIKT